MTTLARPGEGRDDEQEDHQRGVHREQAVVGARREVLVARRRQLGADALGQRAADQEEDEGRAQVLHPDHLVVGVDLEVVLPGVGAVGGVILLDPVVLADQVAVPVVEAADADQEPDAAEQHHEGVLDAGVVGRVAEQPAADRHHAEAPDQRAERGDPRGPHPAPAQPDRLLRAAVAVAVVMRRGSGPAVLRRASSSAAAFQDEVHQCINLLRASAMCRRSAASRWAGSRHDHLIRIHDRLFHVVLGGLRRCRAWWRRPQRCRGRGRSSRSTRQPTACDTTRSWS